MSHPGFSAASREPNWLGSRGCLLPRNPDNEARSRRSSCIAPSCGDDENVSHQATRLGHFARSSYPRARLLAWQPSTPQHSPTTSSS